MSLSHESLVVYQRTIEFVVWSSELIAEKQVKGVLLDQYKRAFISIPLNIAEGSGKYTGRDQARFYDIAKGSALECGACLDVVVAMGIAPVGRVQEGKGAVRGIVSMLTGLSRSVHADRISEEPAEYQSRTSTST